VEWLAQHQQQVAHSLTSHSLVPINTPAKQPAGNTHRSLHVPSPQAAQGWGAQGRSTQGGCKTATLESSILQSYLVASDRVEGLAQHQQQVACRVDALPRGRHPALARQRTRHQHSRRSPSDGGRHPSRRRRAAGGCGRRCCRCCCACDCGGCEGPAAAPRGGVVKRTACMTTKHSTLCEACGAYKDSYPMPLRRHDVGLSSALPAHSTALHSTARHVGDTRQRTAASKGKYPAPAPRSQTHNTQHGIAHNVWIVQLGSRVALLLRQQLRCLNTTALHNASHPHVLLCFIVGSTAPPPPPHCAGHYNPLPRPHTAEALHHAIQPPPSPPSILPYNLKSPAYLSCSG
jgi:hypothetical protein